MFLHNAILLKSHSYIFQFPTAFINIFQNTRKNIDTAMTTVKSSIFTVYMRTKQPISKDTKTNHQFIHNSLKTNGFPSSKLSASIQGGDLLPFG